MKKGIIWLLMLCVLALLSGCASENEGQQVVIAAPSDASAVVEASQPAQEHGALSDADIKDTINEVRNWYIGDIWNTFVDIDSYVAAGTSATGNALDIDFAIGQFDKAIQKKADYDAFMVGLAGEYAEIGAIWTKVSEQIDAMAAFIHGDIEIGGDRFDTGLIDQYFAALDDLVYALD